MFHTATLLVVAVTLRVGDRVESATDCTRAGSLLTYYINGVNGPCWPGFLPFIVIPEITDGTLFSGFSEDRYISGDEVATFIETGGAYIPDGSRIGDLGPEHLFLLDTIHIDMTRKAGVDPNYEVTVGDIEEWICDNGPIPPRAFIIINTGWSFKRGIRYYGSESVMDINEVIQDTGVDFSVLNFLIPGISGFTWPGLSPKAAEYLLDRFMILGIGIDTPSMDAGCHYTFYAGDVPDSRAVRRFLTSYGIYLVHNILLLDIELPTRGMFTTLGVFNMKDATRAPVNVYAEFCVDAKPTLQCQKQDYRNIVFGIRTHGRF